MSEFDVDLMAATPDGRVSLTMSIAQLFKLHRQAVDLTKGSPLSRVKLETARLSPSIPTGKSTSVDGVAKRLGAPKLADSLAYPPRGMRADRAAAYLGMSTSTFLRLVGHSMPSGHTVGGMTIWDRLELDAAFENFKNPESTSENSMHKLLGIKP